MNIGATGELGERTAAVYLRKQGYRILCKNFYTRYGEIDIVASKGEYIVFVEVKTRKPDSLVTGEEAVTAAKAGRLKAAAALYLEKNQTELQPRFDYVGTLLQGDKCTVEQHIENAF